MTTDLNKQKKRAASIDAKIQRAVRDQAVAHIALGELLRIIRDEELWFHLGYRDFSDYCDRTCGFGEGGASRRIRIADVFGPMNLSPTSILSISKMVIISGVVFNKTDALRWMKRGRHLKCNELQKAVRAERRRLVKAGKLPTTKLGTDRVIIMGLHLTEKEDAAIRRAIAEIIDSGHARTHGEAVFYMVKNAPGVKLKKAS